MNRRDDFVPPWGETITTVRKRRNHVVVPAPETMTTCACGTQFVPVRKTQLHCTGKCRQKAYEKGDKARSRRAKYWSSDKGHKTLQRYRETGATKENSRAWRERQMEYREQFLKWVRNNPDAPMEQIFGGSKNRIPLNRAYQVYVSLRHGGYSERYNPFRGHLLSYLKHIGLALCSNAEHSAMLKQGRTHCDQCRMGEIRMHDEVPNTSCEVAT